jgi:hypothetical protein
MEMVKPFRAGRGEGCDVTCPACDENLADMYYEGSGASWEGPCPYCGVQLDVEREVEVIYTAKRVGE